MELHREHHTTRYFYQKQLLQEYDSRNIKNINKVITTMQLGCVTTSHILLDLCSLMWQNVEKLFQCITQEPAIVFLTAHC